MAGVLVGEVGSQNNTLAFGCAVRLTGRGGAAPRPGYPWAASCEIKATWNLAVVLVSAFSLFLACPFFVCARLDCGSARRASCHAKSRTETRNRPFSVLGISILVLVSVSQYQYLE